MRIDDYGIHFKLNGRRLYLYDLEVRMHAHNIIIGSVYKHGEFVGTIRRHSFEFRLETYARTFCGPSYFTALKCCKNIEKDAKSIRAPGIL